MYDILEDYGLLDEQKIEEKIAVLNKDSSKNMLSELERYYDRNLKRIIAEFQNPEAMNIVHYPNLDFDSFSKRISFYADKIIVTDPIYSLLKTVEKGFRIDALKPDLNRELKRVLELKDMADEKILFFAPFRKILHPAIEKINAEAKQDIANPDFRRICEENMIIGLDRNETEEISYSFIFTQLGLTLPRTFTAGLNFKTKKGGSGSVGFGMSSGKPFTLKIKDKPPIELKPSRVPMSITESEEAVRIQVEQMMLEQAEEIISSIHLNSLFKAYPITNFDVMWKLMNWKFGKIPTESKTASTLLEIDLKFLEELKIEDILKIRKKEKSTFEDFRDTFNGFCQEITSLPQTENFKEEVLQLKKEKIDPQLRKLDREFKKIKKYRFIRGTSIAVGSLSCAFLGPIGMPLVTGGIATLLREYSEYYKDYAKMKENPLFFLWKLKTH